MLNKSVILALLIALSLLFSMQPASAFVKISEIMYNPNICSDSFCEWVELYNNRTESVDLTGWTLCEKNLSEGYIDGEGNTHLYTTIILPPRSYAIITDGGTGTEVYDNFAINSNSIALHADASSLCGGLSNEGEEINLKNNGVIADYIIYDGSIANGDGSSLGLCGDSWNANMPTPGAENCPVSEEPAPEERQQEEITDEENEEHQTDELPEKNRLIINETNDVEKPEEIENSTIGITGRAVKHEENNESKESIIYESKSEETKRHAVYIFALIMLISIIYIAIKGAL